MKAKATWINPVSADEMVVLLRMVSAGGAAVITAFESESSVVESRKAWAKADGYFSSLSKYASRQARRKAGGK